MPIGTNYFYRNRIITRLYELKPCKNIISKAITPPKHADHEVQKSHT